MAAGALSATPASAVRLTVEIFLGDLNDVFFGAGDPLVLEIDPATGATVIDQDASAITMLGAPIHLGFNGTLDAATGIYAGAGSIDAPPVSILAPTDHADGDVQELAAGGPGPVDVSDGLGIGAPVSLFMSGGCGPAGMAAASARVRRAGHFVECAISMFLSGFIVAEDFSDVDCGAVGEGSRCEDGTACTTGDVCAAGICVAGPPPNCDDGDFCTTDSCEPTTGCVHDGGDADADGWCDDADNCPRIANVDQVDVDPADGIGDACECRAGAPGVCVLDGAGSDSAECLVEFLVEPQPAVVPQTNRPANRIECADGAACDLDGAANGACRFRLALCLGNRDPRTLCAAPGIDTVRVRSPSPTSSRPNEIAAAAAMHAALAALAPTVIQGRREDEIRFTPALIAPDRCTAYIPLDVPTSGGRGRLRVATRTLSTLPPGAARPLRDADRLRVVCIE